MKKIQLEGTWRLRPEFLDSQIQDFTTVLARPEGKFEFWGNEKTKSPVPYGWLTAEVPGDVIQPLMEHGLLEEPLIKSNTEKSLWIKDLSWWFVKTVAVDEAFLAEEKVFLRFDILDFKADIMINGVVVGHHANTFAPFYEEVKRHLTLGENTIVVRITSGVEDFYNHTSVSAFAASKFAIYDKRMYLRKPQFTYGWDWCKPVPTCGIGRGCALEGISGAKIAYLNAYTKEANEKKATIGFDVEVDQLRSYATDDVEIRIKCLKDGKVVWQDSKEVRVVGGLTYHTFEAEIENPQLWMPNGYGEQPLYQIEAEIVCRGQTNVYEPFHLGIRVITVDQSKQADGTYLFAFVCNGIKIYAKGGNWVPADSVYLRVPDATYETLVNEAAEQHFTMLRMWGGGLYEPKAFYDACDKNGILIMHDFMYACSYYPDHEDWFLHEAKKEADYQTRRLANHACLAMWTGNNENHESFTDWFSDKFNLGYFPGEKIYNYIQPRAVQDNCPTIPYLPSSPFGGAVANSQDEGDSHVWKWMALLGKETPDRVHVLENFDRLTTRFSSEYGFHGPVMESSVRRYLGGEGNGTPENMRFDHPDWVHHGEQVEKVENIKKAITQYFTDASALDETGYLLYGGVNHGMLYREMGEALRKKSYCYGHLIWMYNDCWPETGWTTIDYYLTRKIAFYFLKRTFAPQKIMLQTDGSIISVILHNETAEELILPVLYGNADFSDAVLSGQETTLRIAPFTREEVFSFSVESKENKGYAFVAPKDNLSIDAATTVRGNYRSYSLETPVIEVLESVKEGENQKITIQSSVYAPVVYVQLEDDRTHLSDNYVEMLPGRPVTITVERAADKKFEVKALPIDPV